MSDMDNVMVRIISISLGAFALWVTANAQTGGLRREVLTNRSVVTLAAAGFDEQFIIDTIATSRSQFDTTVDGLAALAKQGINERVIRVMMAAPGPPPPPSAQFEEAVNLGAPPPDLEHHPKPIVFRPKPAALAIAAQSPYYESKSVLFGLYRKRVGVGVAPRVQQVVMPHLGAMYERVIIPGLPSQPALRLALTYGHAITE